MAIKHSKKPIISVTKKDCTWDYYVGSGKGGQKRNKTFNCVRYTHEPSGAVGRSENGRSQFQNKKTAFRKMAESKEFKTWVKIETSRKLGIEAEIQRDVENSMRPSNLIVEVKDQKGKWVKENEQ